MSEARAALIVVLNYEPVPVDELNDWYDLEHIPQRLCLPGFLNAERWQSNDAALISVVLYELTTLAVLTGEPYRSVTGVDLSAWSKRILAKCSRTRFEAELMLRQDKSGLEHAEGMVLVGMNVEADAETEYNRWYDEEHIPALFAIPGVLGARRYRVVTGAQKYLALYHLRTPDVQASPAWAKAIDTPWAARVRPCTRDRVRFVCRRYQRMPA